MSLHAVYAWQLYTICHTVRRPPFERMAPTLTFHPTVGVDEAYSPLKKLVKARGDDGDEDTCQFEIQANVVIDE